MQHTQQQPQDQNILQLSAPQASVVVDKPNASRSLTLNIREM